MFSQTLGVPATSARKYRLPLKTPGGGTNYAAAVNETVTLLEALAAQYNVIQGVAETVTLSDAMASQFAGIQGLSETVTLGEVLAAAYGAVVDAAETVALAEAISASLGIVVGLSETVTLAESLLAVYAVNVALSENVPLSEALSASMGVVTNLAETVGWAAALATVFAATVGLAETVGLSDTLIAVLATTVSVSDLLALSDALSASLQAVVALSETETVSAVLYSVYGATAGVNETVSASASLATLAAYTSSFEETLSIAANLSAAQAAYLQGLLETTALIDALSAAAGVSFALMEAVPYEGSSLFSQYNANAVYAVTLPCTEVFSAVRASLAELSESVPYASALAGTRAAYVFVVDTLSHDAALSTQFDGTQTFDEFLSLTELLAARYAVALDFPIGVGWYASVDGYSLILSTVNTLTSGELPLRTSGTHGEGAGRSIRILKAAETPLAAGGGAPRVLASVVQPIRKLKDGK